MMNQKLKSGLRLLTLSLGLCSPLLVTAAEGDATTSAPRSDRAVAVGARERFDADGDGQLNASERETMRAAMRERRAKVAENRPGLPERRERMRDARERFDTDGDGRLNDTERAAADQAMRAELPNRPRLMARVDTDGNGEISDPEWAAARETLQERRRDRMDHDRPGPPRNLGKPPGPPPARGNR